MNQIQLRDVRIFEVSLVLWPKNPAATVEIAPRKR